MRRKSLFSFVSSETLGKVDQGIQSETPKGVAGISGPHYLELLRDHGMETYLILTLTLMGSLSGDVRNLGAEDKPVISRLA